MQSSAKTKPAVVTQHLSDAGRGINLLVSLPILGEGSNCPLLEV